MVAEAVHVAMMDLAADLPDLSMFWRVSIHSGDAGSVAWGCFFDLFGRGGLLPGSVACRAVSPRPRPPSPKLASDGQAFTRLRERCWWARRTRPATRRDEPSLTLSYRPRR